MPGSPHGVLLKGLTATADEVTTMGHMNRAVLVQRGIIAVTTLGSNQMVAAVAGKYIVVVAYNIMSGGTAVNATWRSGATDISGPTYMTEAGRGKVAPYNPKGWFATAAGQALNLNLSAGQPVGGEFTYVVLEV